MRSIERSIINMLEWYYTRNCEQKSIKKYGRNFEDLSMVALGMTSQSIPWTQAEFCGVYLSEDPTREIFLWRGWVLTEVCGRLYIGEQGSSVDLYNFYSISDTYGIDERVSDFENLLHDIHHAHDEYVTQLASDCWMSQ